MNKIKIIDTLLLFLFIFMACGIMYLSYEYNGLVDKYNNLVEKYENECILHNLIKDTVDKINKEDNKFPKYELNLSINDDFILYI